MLPRRPGAGHPSDWGSRWLLPYRGGVTEEQVGTREAILEEAIRAIEEGGEASVRVAVVAANVGVAITAIYHHYGSRDGLVESALAERYRRSIQSLDPRTKAFLESVASREEFEAGLAAIMAEIASPDRHSARMARVQVVAGAAGRPGLLEKLREMQLVAVREQVELYRIAQDRGFVAKDLDLKAFASLLTGMVFGRVLQDIVADEVDNAAYNRLAVKALLALVVPEA